MNFHYEDGKILLETINGDEEITVQTARGYRTQLNVAIREYNHNRAEYFFIRRTTYKTHLVERNKIDEGVCLCGSRFEESQVMIDPVINALESFNVCKKCERAYDQRR